MKSDEEKRNYAVLMTDIDKFKIWNDTYGHSVGDIALRVIGQILRDCVRGTEGYIARYGGEEFYIELNDVHSTGAALTAAERIRENVETYGMDRVYGALEKEGRWDIVRQMKAADQTLTMSIGVALEESGEIPYAALRNSREVLNKIRENADNALYVAKDTGRNRVALFQSEE